MQIGVLRLVLQACNDMPDETDGWLVNTDLRRDSLRNKLMSSEKCRSNAACWDRNSSHTHYFFLNTMSLFINETTGCSVIESEISNAFFRFNPLERQS